MKEKEIKCPNCGENLAKIIYGLVPDPGEALKKKKVFIGWCMISDNDPIYHCYNCRRSYFENLKDYIEEANDIFDDYYATKVENKD